ncbi:MAG: Rpn family recombination-promoting nuclease/putative transposase [Acidobacteriota bacterium]|nr:Rpn family recombination-promoting nuclease/putative transposase [Acidobacteriota bacterium]
MDNKSTANRELKFLDPKNDVAFRKIFGDENKKEILISFLNNILEFADTPKEIIDITIKNPYQVPKLLELKETILDIKAVDKRNIHYIIEMQVFHTTAFEKRVLYYVSKAYYQQLDRSEEYPKLNQVIFLGFLDFNLFKQNPHYFTRHLILEEKSNEHHFQDFELNFVELPKFNKTLAELKDIKDKWIYFVKNAENMKMIPTELQEPKELKEAFEVANQMTWTKKELDAYDAMGIYIQDERGRIDYALEEGKEIGEKIGLQKGEKIGFDKGKFEEKQAIARAMLKEGMKPDVIARLTGLAIDDI